MTPELRKVLAFFVATLVVGIAAVRFAPRLLGAAAGPEVDIVSSMLRTEKDGLSLTVPGVATPLVAHRHHFDRITVQADLVARTADAASTLDFVGAMGETEVSSLGVEKTHFAYTDGWRATEGLAPRLVAVVHALEARRRALETADAGALAALLPGGPDPQTDPDVRRIFSLEDRSYRVRGWFIRLDRDAATVSEDYRLRGVLPDRPVDDEGRRTLILERRGSEFFFAKGLM